MQGGAIALHVYAYVCVMCVCACVHVCVCMCVRVYICVCCCRCVIHGLKITLHLYHQPHHPFQLWVKEIYIEKWTSCNAHTSQQLQWKPTFTVSLHDTSSILSCSTLLKDKQLILQKVCMQIMTHTSRRLTNNAYSKMHVISYSLWNVPAG